MPSPHPTTQSPRRGGPGQGFVFGLFYVSGIAGLIYQVLWLRRLSLVFGVTVYAASTVLAARGFPGVAAPLDPLARQ